ncbi:MAG: hypothetical protein IIX14_05455 [Clostridia bacterium]|nr:hypothetical protein [Clostridia bacterium]
MKRRIERLISVLMAILCAMSVMAPITASAEEFNPFENKTISILGDSISTFGGVSSGVAAETTNSTIANNKDYYKKGRFDITLEDTWWMQAANELGAEILVNNSYSNTSIFAPYSDNENDTGYLKRAYNLHDNTGENAGQKPDIIAIYIGTNDVSYHQSSLGTYEDIDFKTLIKKNSNGTYTYKKPVTAAEAYAIMLHKITTSYPDAEVYCFTLLPRFTDIAHCNALIENLSTAIVSVAKHFGCYTVDLNTNSGITGEENIAKRYLMDGFVHPNKKGMDVITKAFLSSIYKNSKYTPRDNGVYDISYNLNNIVADNGRQTTILGGKSFDCMLKPLEYGDMSVTVTMGNTDITEECVSNGKIHIPAVTADVKINANIINQNRTFKNYRFSKKEDSFSSSSLNENYSNSITPITEGGFAIETPIRLCFDTQWTVVFRLDNCSSGEHIVLSDNENNSPSLIIDSEKNILGFKTHDGEVLGANFNKLNIDFTETHTFKITNKHNIDGTNTFSYYVDSVYAGDFNSRFVDGEYSDKDITALYEEDFVYNTICATGSSNTEYIQIWESPAKNGHTHTFEYPIITEPTCTQFGGIVTTCDCGETHGEPHAPALGHKEGNWIMSTPATAEAAGEMYKKCSVCNTITQTKSIRQLKCNKPVVNNLLNFETGIRIYWGRVTGADAYRVYRKAVNGSWLYLGSTTASYFDDKTAQHGYWYSYTVRAVNEVGYSDFQASKSIQAFNTPVLRSATNVHTGITLKWDGIYGAKGYYVYRKIDNGNWEYYCCTSKTTYTDKNVYNGVTYSYRVRAFRNNTVSGFSIAGITLKRFSSPVLKAPTNNNSGITVQWNKLAGAQGYYVYRKTSSGSWKYLGRTTNTYFYDNNTTPGSMYTYTVKAYSNASVSSYNTAGITTRRLLAPQIKDFDMLYNGIKVQWRSVKGAQYYQVYRKTGSGAWQCIGTTDNLYYKDRTAKKGVTYTYTIKAVSGSYVSAYNTKGASVKR